jgi:hypothetical protein
MSGTSMLVPDLGGAIALVISGFPSWSYEEIYNAFKECAVHIPLTPADRECELPDYPNQACGWGRIDVACIFPV